MTYHDVELREDSNTRSALKHPDDCLSNWHLCSTSIESALVSMSIKTFPMWFPFDTHLNAFSTSFLQNIKHHVTSKSICCITCFTDFGCEPKQLKVRFCERFSTATFAFGSLYQDYFAIEAMTFGDLVCTLVHT